MTDNGWAPIPLQKILYSTVVRKSLIEDLGRAGDITTDAIVNPGAEASATLRARFAGIIAGIDVALEAFRILDPQIRIKTLTMDGLAAASGDTLALLNGSSRALLSAERTALNFLGHMSGIATATRDIVSAVSGFPARVVCTRKTTPGLRILEKYAVRAGGGSNHRFGLDDAALIKDNHIAVAGGISEAVHRVRRQVGHMVKIEVEVDTLEQLAEALSLKVDAVLLDNMTVDILAKGVKMARDRAITEASGNISRENARAIAATGVDLISVGWITHSAPSLDVALDFAATV